MSFDLTIHRKVFRYIVCVLAEHNFGLAAMSKSVRFKTRTWWFDDDYCNAAIMRGDRTLDTINPAPQPPSPMLNDALTDAPTEVPEDPVASEDLFAKQLYASGSISSQSLDRLTRRAVSQVMPAIIFDEKNMRPSLACFILTPKRGRIASPCAFIVEREHPVQRTRLQHSFRARNWN